MSLNIQRGVSKVTNLNTNLFYILSLHSWKGYCNSHYSENTKTHQYSAFPITYKLYFVFFMSSFCFSRRSMCLHKQSSYSPSANLLWYLANSMIYLTYNSSTTPSILEFFFLNVKLRENKLELLSSLFLFSKISGKNVSTFCAPISHL